MQVTCRAVDLHAAIDKQGRVLLPKQVREQIGVRPHSQVRLNIEDGKLILTAAGESRCLSCGQTVADGRGD